MLSNLGSISSFTVGPSVVTGLTANSYVTSAEFEADAQIIFLQLSGSWSGTTLEVFVCPDGNTLNKIEVLNLSSWAFGFSLTTTGFYAAQATQTGQVGQGVVYVVATSAITGGSVKVTLTTGPAMDWLDVTVFGAVGDGATDDTSAIQLAFNACSYLSSLSVSGNLGFTLFFPPGTYNISSTIQPAAHFGFVQNVRFQGYPSAPSKGAANLPGSVLCFTGTSGAMILSNPAFGFTLQDLGLTYNNGSFNGYLVDFSRGSGGEDSEGVHIQNCMFYPTGTVGNGCAAYLYLDDGQTSTISCCSFTGAQYAIFGIVAASHSSNGVSIGNGTLFGQQAVAPIRNPGNAWSFNSCVVENNASGAAAFIVLDPGFTSNGLSIVGCWMGDDQPLPGTWISWAGNGLLVSGNQISCNQFTTAIAISNSNCSGICIQGNQIQGAYSETPVANKAIDFGSTTGHNQFVFLGNNVTNIATPIAGAIPPSSVYTGAGGPAIDSLVAGPAAFTGLVKPHAQLAGSIVGVNLLPFDDATFENGFVTNAINFAKYDWEVNLNCALTASSVAASGSYSMQMESTSTPSAEPTMSAFWPSTAAVNGGLRGVPVIAGQNVTILASFRTAATSRTVEIKANGFPIGSNVGASLGQTLSDVTGESMSAWVQLSLAFTMPPGYDGVGLTVAIVNQFGSNLPTSEKHYVDNVCIAICGPIDTTQSGNLLPIDDSSFEVFTGSSIYSAQYDWQPDANSAISQSGSFYFSGSESMKLAFTGGASISEMTVSWPSVAALGNLLPGIPVSPGQSVTIVASFLADPGSTLRLFQIVAQGYSSFGSTMAIQLAASIPVAEVHVGDISNPTEYWQQATLTFIVPPGIATVGTALIVSAATGYLNSADIHYIDVVGISSSGPLGFVPNTNLLPSDDASFEIFTGPVGSTIGYADYDWMPATTGGNCILAQAPSGIATSGSFSMQMESVETGSFASMAAFWPSTHAFDATLYGVPASSGQIVTMSAAFRALAAPRNVEIRAWFYVNSSSSPTSPTDLGIFSNTSGEAVGGWFEQSLTFVMPTGYEFVAIGLSILSDSGNLVHSEIHYVDGVSISVGYPTPLTSGVNLLPSDDATFENAFATNQLYFALNDWSGSNCTPQASKPGIASSGAYSMELQSSGSGNVSVTWPSPAAITAGLLGVPVAPGNLVTILASFRASSTARSIEIVPMGFAIGTNTLVALPVTPASLTATGETSSGWLQQAFTFMMPAGYDAVGAVLEVLSTASGEIHYVDNVSIAIGSSTAWSPPNNYNGTLASPSQWAPPGGSFLLTDGSSIRQMGAAANVDTLMLTNGLGRVSINNGVGGSGGLYVGNGAGYGGSIAAGSLALGVTSIAGPNTYNILSSDHFLVCNATSGAITANLPDAAGCAGRIYTLVKTDASGNGVTITPVGSETINGGSSLILQGQWQSATLISDGANWEAVDSTAITTVPQSAHYVFAGPVTGTSAPGFRLLAASDIPSISSGITGVLPVANGGTGATAFTAGSVVFAGPSGVYSQSNQDFFWLARSSPAAPALGLGGTTSPGQLLDLYNGHLRFTQVSAPTGYTAAGTGSGPLTGTYGYAVSFVTASGETLLGAVASATLSGQEVTISGIPAALTQDHVISMNIYRSASAYVSGAPMYLLATVTPSATSYIDPGTITPGIVNLQYKGNTTAGRFFLGPLTAGCINGSNTALGVSTLAAVTGGTNNMAFGSNALNMLTTGNSNVGIGYAAGFNLTSGGGNMLVGSNAGFEITSGGSNTCIGYGAGYNGSNSITTGIGNTHLGWGASFVSASQWNYTVAIGMESYVGASNTMALGGMGTYQTAIVINGTTASAQLHVNSAAVGTVGLIVNGSASATANLQDWQVNGSTLLAVNSNGTMLFTPVSGHPAYNLASSSTVSSPNTGDNWYDGTNFMSYDGVSAKRARKREAIFLSPPLFTPAATGGIAYEIVVPFYGDGTTSVTWNVRRINFRVQTAGGAPEATVEVSTGTGAFSATAVGSVTLATLAYEGATTSGFTTATVASGNKLRLNAAALGTAQNWFVSIELEEA